MWCGHVELLWWQACKQTNAALMTFWSAGEHRHLISYSVSHQTTHSSRLWSEDTGGSGPTEALWETAAASANLAIIKQIQWTTFSKWSTSKNVFLSEGHGEQCWTRADDGTVNELTSNTCFTSLPLLLHLPFYTHTHTHMICIYVCI